MCPDSTTRSADSNSKATMIAGMSLRRWEQETKHRIEYSCHDRCLHIDENKKKFYLIKSVGILIRIVDSQKSLKCFPIGRTSTNCRRSGDGDICLSANLRLKNVGRVFVRNQKKWPHPNQRCDRILFPFSNQDSFRG